MLIASLTEKFIRAHSLPQVFRWGQKYYRQGTVVTLIQRGDTLTAEVAGSEETAYQVSIELAANQLISARCTCAYQGQGWCKHIVASLLKYSLEPQRVEQRPSLETQLEHLTPTQLQSLINTLVTQHPHLLKIIETQLSPPAPPPVYAVDQINAKTIRRHLRDSLNYGFDNEFFRQFLTQVATFIQSGDTDNTFTILEIISEEAIRQWRIYEYNDDYEDDGSIIDFFKELDNLWAEAILSFNLSIEQLEYWETYLTNLENQLIELGGNFMTALNAVHYGWNYPPLQKILHGISEEALWEEELREEKVPLVKIYLRLLVRQQRYESYLQLAKVQQHYKDYVGMAWRLRRLPEVFWGSFRYLKKKLTT